MAWTGEGDRNYGYGPGVSPEHGQGGGRVPYNQWGQPVSIPGLPYGATNFVRRADGSYSYQVRTFNPAGGQFAEVVGVVWTALAVS